MSKAKSLFLLVILTGLLLPATVNTAANNQAPSENTASHQQIKQNAVDWCCVVGLSCCVNGRNAR